MAKKILTETAAALLALIQNPEACFMMQIENGTQFKFYFIAVVKHNESGIVFKITPESNFDWVSSEVNTFISIAGFELEIGRSGQVCCQYANVYAPLVIKLESAYKVLKEYLK